MEWRVIPGYPAYEISESGTVRKASGYLLAKCGMKYRLWNKKRRVQEPHYPRELVELAFGVRKGDPEPQPREAQPPTATGGEAGAQPWRPKLGSGPASIPVPAVPDEGRCAALERENRELRAMVAEIEAELLVYRVAI